ncbi:MAG: glycoside hydrolase family 3 C-terminal domain-containing protein [Clostridia bacterium]|nr:glycoside hydrolase family 3 C-terminal domain-containing protein [Clostridia bacterium]
MKTTNDCEKENTLPKYKDSNLPIEARVADLLSRMTIKEKLQQLHCPGSSVPFSVHYENIQKGENTLDSAIYCFRAFDLPLINRLQEYCLNETRLGIPLLVAAEGTHGLSLPMGTVFPTTGCIAATFDETYAYKMGAAEAKEARACGFNQLYAPNVDLLQDARWGRCEENYGEDPFLTGNMGTAVVRGIQDNGVAATMKHYLAFGTPESGLNLSAVHVGEREVREYMLRPFKECVQAGVMCTMPSYSEIDGVPVHISRYWMHEVLREELGFQGMVITDYGSSGLLLNAHCSVENELELGKLYLEAGVDMEACFAVGYGQEMKEAVERGEVDERKIDAAVSRVLTTKFKLGLFENPYFDETAWQDQVFTPQNRALCREIAEKGVVLLKNDGVLPFSDKKVKKIALVGPNAEIAQLGSYCYYDDRDKDKRVNSVASRSITLRQALIARYGAENVFVELGVGFAEYEEGKVARALACAKKADVVIFAGGHNSISLSGGDAGGAEQRERVSDWAITSGEGYDRHDTDLPKPQKRMLKELSALGKPLTLVLYGGTPISFEEELPLVNAVLLAFGVGSDGNLAVADILAGKVVPSGKLPFSIPRSVGHIPCYYNHKQQGKGSLYQKAGSYDRPGMDYVFSDSSALFPFGYGLSYTEFAYTELTAAKPSESVCRVEVTVENIGDYDAEESVLVFARNMRTKIVTGIVKKLVAYRRIKLKKGGRQTVRFEIPAERFAYVGIEMQDVLPQGEVKIFIGDKETTVWF